MAFVPLGAKWSVCLSDLLNARMRGIACYVLGSVQLIPLVLSLRVVVPLSHTSEKVAITWCSLIYLQVKALSSGQREWESCLCHLTSSRLGKVWVLKTPMMKRVIKPFMQIRGQRVPWLHRPPVCILLLNYCNS